MSDFGSAGTGMPEPMDDAPPGDGWLLVQEAPRDDTEGHAPWVIATRCDDGWCDDYGYPVEALAWCSLPDPQPKGTGWRPASGYVLLTRGWLGEQRIKVWMYIVKLDDGSDDPERGGTWYDDYDVARENAAAYAEKLGLELREERDNVVPFMPRAAK